MWCDVSGSAVYGEDGRVTHILTHFLDITARKEFERSIITSGERWKAAFEFAPVGMAEISLDGHFRQVNPALCEILGYTAEQLCEMTPLDISHPDDAEVVQSGGGRACLMPPTSSISTTRGDLFTPTGRSSGAW